ncbi:SH2 domain-containing adapter protein D [Erinaceus europaeus]|uniref:SH2 domain-containing adapter protein D n=1 Tax=Erinaceus europaeus TaxID=9365 RepID=A0ABM3WN86_ERIEU|nr:SH2 domain-containing adapter protein D [Erinaceus europaeus]
MARWLRDYLSFGGRRPPPRPPAPDYTGDSDVLRAYREQRDLDFEDPYEDPEPGDPRDPKGPAATEPTFESPKHRLIKVEDAPRARGARGSPDPEPEADTEYSDPYDAHPVPPVADGGYVGPYDAQPVASELPGRSMQLYDTPYEQQDRGPEGVPRNARRLPREDERPADEYDQPWEWKKESISKAFAVQFDSPEWDRTLGSAKELRRPPPRSPQPAERVDPALPLERQPWFHGPLSRADAENLLSLCKEGSYLVRLSETSQDCSLSLRSSQGFLHLKFTRTSENQLVLGQHSGPFASVPELVLHYSSRPLPVQGAEHLALLYPVVTAVP